MRCQVAAVIGLLVMASCGPALLESPPPAIVVGAPAPRADPAATPERHVVPDLVWSPISPHVEMARTEATVRQYRACVEARACSDKMLHGIDWPGRVDFEPRQDCTWPQGDDQLPVNCVSYADAMAFCAFAGGRLQSFDEWLLAASNGRTTRWPWGDVPEPDCDLAVMGMHQDACARTNPKPVCSRPRGNDSAGICDLVGNVYEWTVRPTAPGQPWVMAGECYNNFVPSRSLEAMTLTIDDERYRTPPLGIRCVRDRD